MKFSHPLRNSVFFGLIILVFASSLVSSNQTAQAQDEGPGGMQPTIAPTFPPEPEIGPTQPPADEDYELNYKDPPYLSADGNSLFNAAPILIIRPGNGLQENNTRIAAIKGLQSSSEITIDYLTNGEKDTFDNNCQTFPEDARTAFLFAANAWEPQIHSTVPITILACWSNSLSMDVLGVGGGQPLRSDSDFPKSGTWYVGAVANAFEEKDLFTDKYDMHISFNNNITWYTGLDGITPSTEHDFITVAMHEIGHGLGFTGSATVYEDPENPGIFLGKLMTSGKPEIFDTYMTDAIDTPLLDYDNDSKELGDVLTSSVWFSGPYAVQANSGFDIQMYAPRPWKKGSSYSHFSDRIDYQNELMVPILDKGVAKHAVGPLEKGVLKDCGWAVTKGLPPDLYSPHGIIYSRTPTFKWTPIVDATNYQIQIFQGTTKVVEKNVGCGSDPCSYKLTGTQLKYAFHTWQVKAYANGKWTDLSSSLSFKIQVTIPKPTSPDGKIYERKPVYSWTGSAGIDSYEVVVYQGGTTVVDTTVSSAVACSGTSCKVTPNTLLKYANHSWKVRAQDEGDWSVYSGEKAFSVNVPPPTISKPSGNIYVKRPTFTWTPYQYASDYRLQVFQGSTIKIDKTLTKSVCTPTVCSYTPSSDLAYADYTWKARTKAEGVWSEEWSATKSFKVNGPPTPQSPSGNTYDNTPTYKWTAVSGSDKYRLEVYRGTAFVEEYLIDGTHCSAGICTYTPASPKLNYAAHTWKVQAWGNNAWQAYSASKAFTVINPVPDTRGPNGKIYGLSPTYKWGSVTGASKYRFQVYKGTTLVYEKTALSSACTGGECKSTPTEVLTNGVEHKWRVQSYAGGAWQTYSGYAVFTPYSQIPVLLNPSGYTYILNPTYTFTEVLYAMGYQVEITDGMNNITTYTVWPSSCSEGICSMASPYDLYYYYDYKWRVRAKISEVWKDWSSYTVFYARDPLVRIYGPKGTTFDDTPLLVWTTVEGATQYMVEMVNRDTSASSVLTITSPICADGFCRADWTPALDQNYQHYKYRIAAYGGGGWQIYCAYQDLEFYTLRSGLTARVSVTSLGGEPDGPSQTPAISADGHRIVFMSSASNLGGGYYCDLTQCIFLFDIDDGSIKHISHTNYGYQMYQNADSPAISGDGRYVAFTSASDRMVPIDLNAKQDVFLHDTEKDGRVLVSVDSNEVQANNDSFKPDVSGDGRYVVFYSAASNLVTGDTNGISDVFIRDTVAGTTTRVSVSSSGGQANGGSYLGGISPDGNLVVFSSSADNLVSGDANGKEDIFVRNLSTGVTTLVSLGSDGITQGDGQSYSPSISDDGRYVTFSSDAENFGSGNDGYRGDIFIKNTLTGVITCITPPRVGIAWSHGNSKISGDGSTVVFYSAANYLIGAGNDTNSTWDVFAYDVATQVITRVSIDSSGAQANGGSDNFDVSEDGTFIIFESDASNLILNDLNDALDIFLHIQ